MNIYKHLIVVFTSFSSFFVVTLFLCMCESVSKPFALQVHCYYRIRHVITGYAMLLPDTTCYYRICHVITGYAMLLPDTPCYYRIRNVHIDKCVADQLPPATSAALLPQLSRVVVRHNRLAEKAPFFIPRFILELQKYCFMFYIMNLDSTSKVFVNSIMYTAVNEAVSYNMIYFYLVY